MSKLDGRVAIVTGAAQGIGAAYAKAFAAEGAKVVITDIDDCEPVARDIRTSYQGAEVLALRTDVSSEKACEEMVAKTVERFGRLDILVPNAAMFGKLGYKGFEDIPVAEFDAVMAVNIKGPWLCIKAATPQMKKQGYGKIINIASGTIFKGSPNLLHYVSSKGAILAMTRSLARELGDHGIRVNSLAPGLTMSEAVIALDEDHHEQHVKTVNSRAIKREQTPDDLVGAMIFLASADSDFMTGQCMVVDGGSVNH
jgi:NAD(P)-dependent dehydrogenase (short-subunit alcohol dehydrogenase family)